MKIIDPKFSFSRLNLILGSLMIVLGIIIWIVTYKYVLPIGSTVLIICGIFLILIRNSGIRKMTRPKRNKLSDIEDEVIILDFLTRNKTKDTYAFSLEDISKCTGIKNLTHERLSKIENIEYVELYRKIWYTCMSTEEKFQRALDQLVKEGKIKEEIKDGVKLYRAI